MEVKSHLYPLVAFFEGKKHLKSVNKETGWTFKSVVRLPKRREKSVSPAGDQTEFLVRSVIIPTDTSWLPLFFGIKLSFCIDLNSICYRVYTAVY
jgi:hypothetical protein